MIKYIYNILSKNFLNKMPFYKYIVKLIIYNINITYI